MPSGKTTQAAEAVAARLSSVLKELIDQFVSGPMGVDICGTEVSANLISSVTDAVMSAVGAWQSRPQKPMYPVVFVDTLRVKAREHAVVRNKAINLALGMLTEGGWEVLGVWIETPKAPSFGSTTSGLGVADT
jgi:hypothetical protein